MSRDEACTGPLEVEIHRRSHGSEAYEVIGSTPVNGAGVWGLQVNEPHNSSYVAKVKKTASCDGLASAPLEVLVKAKVKARGPRSCTGGKRNVVKGRVLPDAPGSEVLLQKRTRRGWKTTDSSVLDERSRFRMKTKRCGVHRIV